MLRHLFKRSAEIGYIRHCSVAFTPFRCCLGRYPTRSYEYKKKRPLQSLKSKMSRHRSSVDRLTLLKRCPGTGAINRREAAGGLALTSLKQFGKKKKIRSGFVSYLMSRFSTEGVTLRCLCLSSSLRKEANELPVTLIIMGIIALMMVTAAGTMDVDIVAAAVVSHPTAASCSARP